MNATKANATVWAGPDAAEPAAVFVHGVLSWGTDDRYGFGGQRPLASSRRLILMDRCGHGVSPDLLGRYRTDYETDAHDIIALLGDGAHVVGHSYGGVAALLAASWWPELVRSLCLIQPGWLSIAEHHPVVADTLHRARAATADEPPDLDPAEYLRKITDAVGMPPAPPTEARVRVAATAMHERPCWDADIDLEPIIKTKVPTMVILGDWDEAPGEYQSLAGNPLTVAGEMIAEYLSADLRIVPGFYPHVQHPDTVNALLDDFWKVE